MNTTRFLLENLAARVVGTKIPPYWLGRPVELAEVDAATFSGIKQLSDDELADWVRSNALGIPMQMPMTLRIEFEDVKFMVVGKFEDVMDAQAEFLQAIIKDE